MGVMLQYVITGTFISTAVLIGVTYVVIFDVINGINEFQNEIEKDLDQFKVNCDCCKLSSSIMRHNF